MDAVRLSDRVDIDILEPHGPGELAMLVVRVDGHDEVRHFVGEAARRAIEDALAGVAEAQAVASAIVATMNFCAREGV